MHAAQRRHECRSRGWDAIGFPSSSKRRWRLPTQPWRTLAAILVLLGFSVGVSWAGWHFLRAQPLLSDDFDDGWGDLDRWATPRRIVREENGHVRLVDRGMLVTNQEFPAPIRLSFRWKWVDLTGDFLYRDCLCVALRTSGTPDPERPFEAQDGVIIRFAATGGILSVGIGSDLNRPLLMTLPNAYALPADQWHDIVITDDGERIQVFLAGPAIPETQPLKPVLDLVVPGRFAHHRIAFYNRERLASASFESWLDDVEIWPLAR